MINFKDCSEEEKNLLNLYLDTSKNLDLFVEEGMEFDEDGRLCFKFGMGGETDISTKRWLRSVAMEFRKLYASDEPINYNKTSILLGKVFQRISNEEEYEKISNILRILKGYKNKHWNDFAYEVSYKDKILTADEIILITHNAYLFHSGINKKHVYIQEIKDCYPDINPVQEIYLQILRNRIFCIKSLTACIQLFKEGNLLISEWNENFKPDFIIERDFLSLSNFEITTLRYEN